MRWRKISSLMYRDSLVIRRIKYRSLEIVYFPITTVIIWGLFAVYARQMAAEAGLIVLIINIFWAFAHLAQTNSNILMMEDIWSGSLKQVLLTGITEFEYIIARMMTASVTSTFMVIVLVSLSLLFGINFFHTDVIFLILITLIGSLALSVVVASRIFYMGREYGFLTWSAIQLFIMFSAPFFPKEMFPKALLYLSYVMPFTAVFEAARGFSTTGTVPHALLIWGAAVVAGYFVVSWPLYYLSFRRAKKNGMLARMY
ncbi:ABC transporter permease [Candidatus Woesearchaeota archaeon]|nr:ABC transporter permease [Candidatus Woesearchaeota archaeon]